MPTDDWKQAFFAALSGSVVPAVEAEDSDAEASMLAHVAAKIADIAVLEIESRKGKPTPKPATPRSDKLPPA